MTILEVRLIFINGAKEKGRPHNSQKTGCEANR